MVLAIILLTLAGTAAAAVTLGYQSSQATLGSIQAPVVWSAGADASFAEYVPSLVLSTNATSFSLSLRGVPETQVNFSDLIRLSNVDTRSHAVTLSTNQVTNSFVTEYKLMFYSGPTLLGTLDLKAATPTVSFADFPPASTYVARATITLAGGAGSNNVADVNTIAASVTS